MTLKKTTTTTTTREEAAGLTGVIPLALNHLFTLRQARLRIPNFREQISWLFTSVTVWGFELETNKDKCCKRLGSGLNSGPLDYNFRTLTVRLRCSPRLSECTAVLAGTFWISGMADINTSFCTWTVIAWADTVSVGIQGNIMEGTFVCRIARRGSVFVRVIVEWSLKKKLLRPLFDHGGAQIKFLGSPDWLKLQ